MSIHESRNMVDFIACQSFAGGFDTGAVQAGLRMVHKVEQRGGFGLANCEANRHILGYDWTSQACDPMEWEVMPAQVVTGNPPCSLPGLVAYRPKSSEG